MPPGPSPAALDAYYAAVRARIEAAKRYPAWARRRGVEGRTSVAFRVGAHGDLAEARVAESSGSSALDDAAVEALRRAAPYPAAPAGVDAELTVTLVFALR